MDQIKEALVEQFKAAGASPFLFIGSGFSRRYLGLEDWSSLLRKFTAGLKDYEFYLSSANGDLPTVASMIAEDFHEYWWTADSYHASREKNKTKIRDRTSALRLEICSYLNEISVPSFSESPYAEEIGILSKLNVDGIITTNWDAFLESLFPDYRVFVGQNELLFANPQSIAEIYKIHGSSNRPGSLVLTREDYAAFERQNAYLAAKLITLFVEHPIVFIGYSLSDRNISSLLSSIVACLGEANLQKLRDNLIFVQRALDQNASISNTFLTIDGIQLPITLVKTDDFASIYEAMDDVKRKVPARIMRMCKEQLYELVKSSDPAEKLSVIDIDDIEKKEDVEFVIGVGITGTLSTAPSGIGYQGLTAVDLFKDLVEQDQTLDASRVLSATIPNLSKNCKYLPVYKYLRIAGVPLEDALARYPDLKAFLGRKPADFATKLYSRQYVQSEREKSTVEIISSNPPEKAALFLPFIPPASFDLDAVQRFLADNIEKVEAANSTYSTYFRKLSALFDYYKYGPN
ncbi:SIR2 family protein [uncultured Xanthomonas sp.]|uniref:SIR2 family protein n=1 Tax=uncultured Xanthomonas sp. TaxID=152831 RepID=UPI0025FCA2E1|nr:SIR2 family protein [uncultured Xanthomonas sp.]